MPITLSAQSQQHSTLSQTNNEQHNLPCYCNSRACVWQLSSSIKVLFSMTACRQAMFYNIILSNSLCKLLSTSRAPALPRSPAPTDPRRFLGQRHGGPFGLLLWRDLLLRGGRRGRCRHWKYGTPSHTFSANVVRQQMVGPNSWQVKGVAIALSFIV